MRLEDRLNEQQKKQLNQMRKPTITLPKKNKVDKKKHHKPQQPKPKKEERVNWVDIMGSNNRGMKRKKGGAWTNG